MKYWSRILRVAKFQTNAELKATSVEQNSSFQTTAGQSARVQIAIEHLSNAEAQSSTDLKARL
jgi:hypothetical protein